jgi:class III poly(R)-hydroxyalkanoic acid synthase PhaE subunit
MSGQNFDPTGELSKLAQQYWNAWNGLASNAQSDASLPGFKQGLAWWTQLAGSGNEDLNATLERTNAQAGQWFGAMQELAGKFAGKPASAADIAQAWRESLGGVDGNPVADMFRRMSGVDAHAMDAWTAQAAPYLNALRGEAGALLGLPTFGLAREHQERLQKLVQAQLAYQERVNDYSGLLAGAGRAAFERFERKLGERSEPGRQIESARALFDLWIDAAEEAWAELALGTEYRRVYADLVNAQMRLRAGVQREIELAAGMLGLPTRSEVNASHRKLAMLEREVRALKSQLLHAGAASRQGKEVASESQPSSAKSRPAPTRKSKAKASNVAPSRKTAASKSPSRRPSLPQVTAPRAPQRVTPAKKSTSASRKAR